MSLLCCRFPLKMLDAFYNPCIFQRQFLRCVFQIVCECVCWVYAFDGRNEHNMNKICIEITDNMCKTKCKRKRKKRVRRKATVKKNIWRSTRPWPTYIRWQFEASRKMYFVCIRQHLFYPDYRNIIDLWHGANQPKYTINSKRQKVIRN